METFWKLPTHGEHRSMLTKTAVCSVKRAPKRRNFLKPVKRSDAAALARLAVRTPYLSRIPQLGLTGDAQSLRSEVDRFLPLGIDRSALL
jgi:hypothetical protein